MKALSQTVKNFVSQLATDAIVWALEAPFPISKAIKKNDHQKIEKLVEKTKDYNFLIYIDEAAKHGDAISLQILLETFERRFPHIFKNYKTNAPLLYAAENGHTECALMLLDESETDYKYKAFDAALKNQMDAFLVPFIQQIPGRSTRWPHVLSQLAHPDTEQLLLLAVQRCKDLGAYAQLESNDRRHIEHTISRAQKNRITHHLDNNSAGVQPKRKM